MSSSVDPLPIVFTLDIDIGEDAAQRGDADWQGAPDR
jgi:hypothetical protein